MGAERPLARAQSLHDPGDRDDGGVACENGVAARVALDLAEQLLLDGQVLQHGFDDEIGIGDGIGKQDAWPHPLDRRLVVAEILQIGRDPCPCAVEARGIRIVDRDVVTGEGEHLRNAVPHQSRTDHGYARHRHPAV